MERAAAVVLLSRDRALSEYHPLREVAARLASKSNLEGNLPCQHALGASSVRPAKSLSLLALSALGSLSQNPLTRAKHENGAKRAFERAFGRIQSLSLPWQDITFQLQKDFRKHDTDYNAVGMSPPPL